MVEFEQYDTRNESQLIYNYLIGFIEDDEYYTSLYFEDTSENRLFIGEKEIVGAQNPYSKNGVLNTKKYFGSHSTFAYEIDGQIIVIKSDNYSLESGSVIDEVYYEMLNIVSKTNVNEYYDGD